MAKYAEASHREYILVNNLYNKVYRLSTQAYLRQYLMQIRNLIGHMRNLVDNLYTLMIPYRNAQPPISSKMFLQPSTNI